MSIQIKAAGPAAAYGTLGLYWTFAGHGFPFGRDDPRNGTSVLRTLDPAVIAPIFAGMLLITAVLLLIMHGSGSQERHPSHEYRSELPLPAGHPTRAARLAMLGWCWAVVVALVIVVPDTRLLTLAGYLPILIVGAPFGWPPIDYGIVFNWQHANQVVCLALGLLVALAVLRWQRRTAGACEACGRDDRAGGWTTPGAAARWGRWATGVAAAVPAFYAVVRLAWAAGIPFGISDEFLAEMQRTGMVWAGLGLGAFALAGAVLTLGLVQRWGEVFPRWMIGLAGKRVPIRLATVPATFVALAVTAASLGLYSEPELYTSELSLAHIPQLAWPLWGAALGAATYAYHLRRRPACRDCGRGLVRSREPQAY
ncbi:hypothetical protein AB0M54_27765 [Actinoplanes sp. NPDC051470]|uniref:hypothetical protein n=1 Tax=Actinoplanes sp. NPDC051470 TaxID=3157224 RepID=UPI00342ABDF0